MDLRCKLQALRRRETKPKVLGFVLSWRKIQRKKVKMIAKEGEKKGHSGQKEQKKI